MQYRFLDINLYCDFINVDTYAMMTTYEWLFQSASNNTFSNIVCIFRFEDVQ